MTECRTKHGRGTTMCPRTRIGDAVDTLEHVDCHFGCDHQRNGPTKNQLRDAPSDRKSSGCTWCNGCSVIDNPTLSVTPSRTRNLEGSAAVFFFPTATEKVPIQTPNLPQSRTPQSPEFTAAREESASTITERRTAWTVTSSWRGWCVTVVAAWTAHAHFQNVVDPRIASRVHRRTATTKVVTVPSGQVKAWFTTRVCTVEGFACIGSDIGTRELILRARKKVR